MKKLKLITGCALILMIAAGCSDEDIVKPTETAYEGSKTEKEVEQPKKEQSKKDIYEHKLIDAKKQIETIRTNVSGAITIELKGAEGEIYDIVDPLLNEIYGELKNQLSKDEMEKVRVEQRKWIEDRDEAALKASKEYEGGTHEQLEYVTIVNNWTIARAEELVQLYMK